MIKKLLDNIASQRRNERRAELYRNLIRHEAKIGGELFGPIAPGGRREFFCLDDRTWVWHEEWIDNASGQPRSKTTRYDVRPDKILKSQSGHYQEVTKEEANRLLDAARLYQKRVHTELYSYVA